MGQRRTFRFTSVSVLEYVIQFGGFRSERYLCLGVGVHWTVWAVSEANLFSPMASLRSGGHSCGRLWFHR